MLSNLPMPYVALLITPLSVHIKMTHWHIGAFNLDKDTDFDVAINYCGVIAIEFLRPITSNHLSKTADAMLIISMRELLELFSSMPSSHRKNKL